MANKSEWFVGSRHDELLEITRQMRKTQERMQTQAHSRDKHHAPVQRVQHSTSQHELVSHMRELFEDNYDEVFDVFTELDVQNNGKVTKREFCEGLKAIVSTGARKISDKDLEDLFNAADKDHNGTVSLREFVEFFGKQRPGLKAGKSGAIGKPSAQRRRKRPFDEVLIDCRDERGIERTFPVDPQISFQTLLEKLESKFQRPVTLMYEIDGHQRTIKNASELKDCWDALERDYSLSGKPLGGSAHFEAFAVNFDAASAQGPGGAGRMGRVTLEPQRALREAEERGSGREAAASMDFAGRHKWIDGMMRVLGVPLDDEPPSMQGLWDVLAAECKQLDPSAQGTVTLEGFRNALTRTEPRMSADQVEWFVKDADKSENGEVLYREYVRAKKEGRSVAERVSAAESAVQGAEHKIAAALREHFPSLQAAFRRMDADRDGKLSQEEFRKGVEQRLKLRLTPQLLKEVVRRAASAADGFIHYQEFLERFRVVEGTAMDGAADGLTDMELCRQLLQKHANIVEAFGAVDKDGDGRLDMAELHAGLQAMGLHVSVGRCQALLAAFDIDGNRVVDYREFLRKVSQVDLRDVHRARHDDLSRVEERVRMKMRERFDSAMQAFNVMDADADGRLSARDWQQGMDLVFKGSAAEAPSVEQTEALFKRADGSGSGFVAYHEFLHRFQIAPKPTDGGALSFDRQMRQKLKQAYGNITEAFEDLDRDRDNRLSVQDLQEGLAAFFDHEMLEEEPLKHLIERVASGANKESIDYYDFIVHFGMEPKAEGRWEKVVETQKAEDLSKEVAVFRRHMKPSKWFGRGGVLATLRRFDDNGNGRLERGEFLRALRDGLGMKELSDEEASVLLGRGMDKPYCYKPNAAGATGGMGGSGEGTVDINKFMQLFVDVYFEREKTLFEVLLVQNRWQELEEALAAYGKAGVAEAEGGEGEEEGAGGFGAGSTLISKAEFGAAMAGMVRKGLVKESERQVMIQKCEQDERFERDGPLVGLIDYRGSFLDYYIGEERRIHELVAPHWEACMRQFRARGEALKYAEFRDVCREWQLAEGLSEDDIEALIDVIDANGDGTIGVSEFVRRYAGDDAELLQALREHWEPVLGMLHAARPEGERAARLSRPKFQGTLLQAVELNVLGGISAEQLRHLLDRALPLSAPAPAPDGGAGKPPLVDEGGAVLYENWLKRYVGAQLEMHRAFQGVDAESGMPRWDGVVTLFQDLDRCLGAEGEQHQVSWDHFRKVLRRARIDLRPEQVTKLIEHLDPRMSGKVNWQNFVRGIGPGGAEQSSPYFFNGGQDQDMRTLLTACWPELLEQCRKAETVLRKTCTGVLTKQKFSDALKAAPLLKLGDVSKEGKATPHPLVKKILAVATSKFGQRSGAEVEYEALCRFYAGEAFDAEARFEQRWEVVISVLKELGRGQSAEAPLTREVFVERLSRPELALSDAMVDYLVRDQPAGKVDLDTICWRCGRATIVKVLQRKWAALMKLWRAKDAHHAGKLDKAAFRSCLDRADIGLSNLQVEILMNNVEVEADGKYDYDKLLAGKLKGSTYTADAYVGWRAMENHWEQLAESFWEFDVSGDGKVSPAEFTRALQQLKVPALSSKAVIDALVSELNGGSGEEVDFDAFSWRMAFASLREAAQSSGRQLLDAFRGEASKLYEKHKGRLPKKEAEEVFKKALPEQSLRPLHLKILVNRLLSSSVGGDGMVAEAELAKALRELVGEHLGRQESEELRASFGEMQAAATVWATEKWREPGPGGGKTVESGKKFRGVSSLGPEAMKGVGAAGLRRRHMHFFFREGGRLLPRGMEASGALAALKAAREEKIYGSEPWRAFWQTRAKYRSPDIKPLDPHTRARAPPPSQSTAPGPRPAARRPPPQPLVAHEAREGGGGGGQHGAGPGGGPGGAVGVRIKRAMAERYGGAEQAIRALDAAGSGQVSVEALRGVVEGLGLGLSAGEVGQALQEADPEGRGFLLHAEVAQSLLPPPPDLQRLAQARESQGVYARLRNRLRGGDASLAQGGGHWDTAWRGTWGGVLLPSALSPAPQPPYSAPPAQPPGTFPSSLYAAHAAEHPSVTAAYRPSVRAPMGLHPGQAPPEQGVRMDTRGGALLREGGGSEEIRQLYQNTLQQLSMLGQLPAQGTSV